MPCPLRQTYCLVPGGFITTPNLLISRHLLDTQAYSSRVRPARPQLALNCLLPIAWLIMSPIQAQGDTPHHEVAQSYPLCTTMHGFCQFLLRRYYAVSSLPSFEDGQHSGDTRPIHLLTQVKKLLQDIGQMPMFGVSINDFREQLALLIEADEAVTAASNRRALMFTNFTNWALSSRGRVIGTYMDDLICEFYQSYPSL